MHLTFSKGGRNQQGPYNVQKIGTEFVKMEKIRLFRYPPANFLYKMVEHVPHIKPFFYR